MSVTAVKACGMTYYVPTDTLDAALADFDLLYRDKPGWTVVRMAAECAAAHMPATREDPFSERRLKRCILSIKGKRGGRRKKSASVTKSQMEFWD